MNVSKLYEKHYGGAHERREIFSAFAAWIRPERALYPGSFVHIAASLEFPHVTYVDTDKRARSFFAAKQEVQSLVEARKAYPEPPSFDFIAGSYEGDLDLQDEEFDLLISLYAGFISKPCKHYLRVGGHLLVNNSHGDAGLAAIDPDFELVGVVGGRGARRRILQTGLDEYLIPKNDVTVTEALLRERGRGVAYTKTAEAYVFRRL